MTDLARQSCKPIPEGAPALTQTEADQLLKSVPGWSVTDNRVAKTFSFKDYYESTAFVNATAWISHRQDHHPDIKLGYNRVTVSFSTHTVKGLSLNDFICAARIEALFT